MSTSYLPAGLPIPQPSALDQPFWDGLREERLLLQRCRACHRFQWGPEWICHRCQSFDFAYIDVPPEGRIYSWQRVWHPVHSALHGHGPYLIALIEIPHADNVRIIGNLLGSPNQTVRIGAEVEGVFEQHRHAEPPFALLHWQTVS